MYELERISLHNWNMVSAQDIEIRGATCFIGPTGAGKSSIVDAIQTVITGNHSRRLKLNAAVEGRDQRNVRDYCLGVVDDLPADRAHPDNPEGLRARCESTIVLTFRDTESGLPVAVGVMLRANVDERRERENARFIADGLTFRIGDHMETGADGGQYVLPHAQMLDHMGRLRNVRLTQHNTSARRFVEEYLRTMRRRGAQPDPDQFLTAFRNMVAFEPVQDATHFVRTYVLPAEPLNVEHIRGTIQHWRELQAIVDQIEAEIAELGALKQRYTAWGEARLALNTYTFLAAHAERRRIDEDLAAKEAEYARTEAALKAEQSTRANHNQAVQDLNEQLRAQYAYQSNSPEAAKQQHAQDRIERARKDIASVNGRIARRARELGRILRLDELRDHLAQRHRAAVAAAKAVADAATAEARPDIGEIDRLERQALEVLDARDPLARQRRDHERQIDDIAREKAELEKQVAGAGDQAVLSPAVTRFRALLGEHGIGSTPLPEVCEVTDETWAHAAEQILGPMREALIVEDGRTREAFDLLFRHRKDFHTCRIVAAERLRRDPPRVKAGALAEVVETTHSVARAFIDRHLGNVIRVHNEADLAEHDRAVMPNGKMQGGAALQVHRDLQPILGKTAQENARQAAQTRLAELDAELDRLRRTKRLLDDGLEILARLSDDTAETGETDETADTHGGTADAAPQLPGLLRELVSAEGELASAETAYRNIDDPELRRIASEIERLRSEIGRYQAELAETVEPNITAYTQRLNTLSGEYGRLQEQRESRLDRESQAERAEQTPELDGLIELLESPYTIARARQLLATRLLHNAGDERATLARQRAEAESHLDELKSRVKERKDRADRDFRKYYETRHGSNPIEADRDGPVQRLAYALARAQRLEQDELNPHRERVRDARREIERALREDLLAKLADKFHKVDSQKNVLNRRLRNRAFNGMTYAFTYATDPNLSKLYNIARRIAEQPDRGASIVDNADQDPEIAAAMEQVEAILSSDRDTAYLEDYRNYFTFELWMQPEHGGEAVPWSRRSKTASGGQRQAPFYVAIAASMAAAYYPHSRHDRPEGMGLVLFDEAFNRLDVPTTQKLMAFFKSLSLQVLAAAPEAQRPTFLEVADTLVSVNKRARTADLRIQAKGIQAHTHARIAGANPQHLGVEGFRERMAAEQPGAESPRNRAAE